jgi:hypothetical protein
VRKISHSFDESRSKSQPSSFSRVRHLTPVRLSGFVRWASICCFVCPSQNYVVLARISFAEPVHNTSSSSFQPLVLGLLANQWRGCIWREHDHTNLNPSNINKPVPPSVTFSSIANPRPLFIINQGKEVAKVLDTHISYNIIIIGLLQRQTTSSTTFLIT